MIRQTDRFQSTGNNVYWLWRPPSGIVTTFLSVELNKTFTKHGRKITFARAPMLGQEIDFNYSYDESFAWYELNQEEKQIIGFSAANSGERLRVTWGNNLYEYMRRNMDWTEWNVVPATEINRRLNSIGLPPLGPVQENTVTNLSELSDAFSRFGQATADAALAIGGAIPLTNDLSTFQVTTTTANIPYTTGNVVLWTCACGQNFTNVNSYNTHQAEAHGPSAFNAHYATMHPPAVPVTMVKKVITKNNKKVTPTTQVKAKKTGQRADRSGIIADDFNPDDDIEINF